MSPWLFLAHTLLVACVGVTMEIVFTALTDPREKGDLRLMGKSYVWMIPIYMMVYPGIVLFQPKIGAWHVFLRGAVYVAVIFAGEYASGWLIRKATGQVPWDYRGQKWAVHDLIRLDYAPAWFAAALVFEGAVRVLRG